MIVFDHNGNFLRSWGEGSFTRPHGLHMGPDDALYCTDDGNHIVRKYTLDGKLLMTIGIPGDPSPRYSGRPFNRCTHTALSPRGDIYVSDGYGNARIHKFSPDGKLLLSWGRPGMLPGEFNLPHNICCDDDGWVYVADRENHRVQVFDGNGRFECMWTIVHRPAALFMRGGRDDVCYVGELGPEFDYTMDAPNLGPRFSILNKDGSLITRVGRYQPKVEPNYCIPHGMCVDSAGDVYVADLGLQNWHKHFPAGVPEPPDYQTLHKFVKV